MADLLEWINFGTISAERDDLLNRYFYDAGVLTSVLNSKNSFLILGRKGAGKTALFQYFSQNTEKFLDSNDSIVVSLSLQDYSWSAHDALANPAKAPSLAYLQSWKFVIYVQAVSALKQYFEKNNRKSPSILKVCYKIIERIYENPYPSLAQVVGKKILSLTKLKLPGGELGLSEADIDNLSLDAGALEFSDIQSDTNQASILSQNIEAISQIFENSLRGTTDLPDIYVCFDRVDEAWDEGSLDVSKRLIAGLVSASESVNSRLDGKLRPIVFLREDIFEELSLNDKNKLKTDCGKLLAWQKETLFRVIIERINYFAYEADESIITDIDDIFDRDKMRQGMAPTEYLLRRTMMRPRDLIQFFKLIRADMIDRRDDPFNSEEVDSNNLECASIYNAEASYSEWLRDEIIDEWRAQRSDISRYLEAIQNNGSTIITKTKFVSALGNLGTKLTDPQAVEVFRFLFSNSLIGFKIGKSQQWRFKCFNKTQGFIESDEYKIHDGLIRALNLREPRTASAD